MRITLERSNLLKSLNHVHRVVERRNTIPILSNVLLRADGASLDMKATDLDLEITEATPAQVEQAGATTVPAHLLYDIVRKLSDGSEVLLATSADGASMTVASGRSKFSLQCLPQSDFPDLTAGSFSHTFRLKATDLKMLIDRTQFAISTEETRYYLNGIFIHTIESGGQLKLRADRIGMENDNCLIVCETNLDTIFTHVKKISPQLLIVDSIQTIYSEALESAPGSISWEIA